MPEINQALELNEKLCPPTEGLRSGPLPRPHKTGQMFAMHAPTSKKNTAHCFTHVFKCWETMQLKFRCRSPAAKIEVCGSMFHPCGLTSLSSGAGKNDLVGKAAVQQPILPTTQKITGKNTCSKQQLLRRVSCHAATSINISMTKGNTSKKLTWTTKADSKKG